MPHLIERNDHYVAGETAEWTFTVEKDDGSAKDLTSANIEWYLVPSKGDPDSDALYDHTNTGVTAQVTDAPNGKLQVVIEDGVTTGDGGNQFWQRLIVTDSQNRTQIWNGHFPIQVR